MAVDHFLRLSPELITDILLEISTLEALYAIVRASPKCYQVFLGSKENILKNLMYQVIPTAAFIDALAAVQASQLKESRPDRRAVLHFIRRYQIIRLKILDRGLLKFARPVGVPLCQLYRSSRHFVEDLAIRSGDVLTNLKESFGAAASTSLSNGRKPLDMSSTEDGRFQRAFYRYSLYGHLFRTDVKHWGTSLCEHAWILLTAYRPWEIEEILCVENYFELRLNGLVGNIERCFVPISLPLKSASEDTRRDSYPSEMEVETGVKCRYLDYLLSLNMEYLHSALKNFRGEALQRDFSLHVDYAGQGGFLRPFIGDRVLLEQSDMALLSSYAHDQESDFRDSLEKPNEAWLWAYSGHSRFDMGVGMAALARDLGFVFWDSHYLREMGFTGKF